MQLSGDFFCCSQRLMVTSVLSNTTNDIDKKLLLFKSIKDTGVRFPYHEADYQLKVTWLSSPFTFECRLPLTPMLRRRIKQRSSLEKN